MANFIPGLELNRMFFAEVVQPLLHEHFPKLEYAAGLVGIGSDVLGYDTPRSMDHNWGPRLHIFLKEDDYTIYKEAINEVLTNHLPYTFKGHSTNFVKGDLYRADRPKIKKSGKIRHLFQFWTIKSFFLDYLGFDINRTPAVTDWLLFPQQSLLEVTRGGIYHDAIGLEAVRDIFAYYPDDVWKYLMSVQWGKLLDELQVPARSGEAGDEIGSITSAARMVQKIMFLAFLIERKYVPYRKWFGAAFQKELALAKRLTPDLMAVLKSEHWKERQKQLARIYQKLGRAHNNLGITRPLTTKIIHYFGREYPIIDIWKYVNELKRVIKDKKLKNIRYPLGNIDQIVDHARINQINSVYLEFRSVIK